MYNYVKRGLDNGSEKEDNANSQPASQPASEPSIILAVFLVKSKVAYFSGRILSVLERAGYAFLYW